LPNWFAFYVSAWKPDVTKSRIQTDFPEQAYSIGIDRLVSRLWTTKITQEKTFLQPQLFEHTGNMRQYR
jgi:hypothetical protein